MPQPGFWQSRAFAKLDIKVPSGMPTFHQAFHYNSIWHLVLFYRIISRSGPTIAYRRMPLTHNTRPPSRPIRNVASRFGAEHYSKEIKCRAEEANQVRPGTQAQSQKAHARQRF